MDELRLTFEAGGQIVLRRDEGLACHLCERISDPRSGTIAALGLMGVLGLGTADPSLPLGMTGFWRTGRSRSFAALGMTGDHNDSIIMK
jgi:hypothetical protein